VTGSQSPESRQDYVIKWGNTFYGCDDVRERDCVDISGTVVHETGGRPMP